MLTEEEEAAWMGGARGELGAWYRGGLPTSDNLAEALALSLARESRRKTLDAGTEVGHSESFLQPVFEPRGRLEARGRLGARGTLQARGLGGARGLVKTRGVLGVDDVSAAGGLPEIGRLSRIGGLSGVVGPGGDIVGFEGLPRDLQATLELARVEAFADAIVSQADSALLLEETVDWVQGGKFSRYGPWIRGGGDTEDGLWIRNAVLAKELEEEGGEKAAPTKKKGGRRHVASPGA